MRCSTDDLKSGMTGDAIGRIVPSDAGSSRPEVSLKDREIGPHDMRAGRGVSP